MKRIGMGRMAGVSREADSEKIGHEEEIEMASRTYAFDYRQCLLGQPSRLTTDDDPVRADAMRRELLDYSFQFRGRAENLHPIGRAAEPKNTRIYRRGMPMNARKEREFSPNPATDSKPQCFS